MAKTAPPARDGVTVVIPVHNAAAQLEKMLPAWGQVLGTLNRPFQILVVNDGSTDETAAVLQKLAGKVQHFRALAHDTRRGFGACLRTALAETTQPLFFYAGIDNQYTPSDIRPMLERVELRDEIFGKQPDLISGARAGQPRPALVKWVGGAWKLFWRVFAGLPVNDSPPWYGWGASWYRARLGWVFGVPLADVNSAFKLYRTAFLKRFPIQSDGDFVHAELVAKATFLTSIMDEIPLMPKTEPHPPLGPVAADRAKVFRNPEFVFPAAPLKPPEPPAPKAETAQPTVAGAPAPKTDPAPPQSPAPVEPDEQPKAAPVGEAPQAPTPQQPTSAPAPQTPTAEQPPSPPAQPVPTGGIPAPLKAPEPREPEARAQESEAPKVTPPAPALPVTGAEQTAPEPPPPAPESPGPSVPAP